MQEMEDSSEANYLKYSQFSFIGKGGYLRGREK